MDSENPENDYRVRDIKFVFTCEAEKVIESNKNEVTMGCGGVSRFVSFIELT